MDFPQKFQFGVGLLLIGEGISGIILFSMFNIEFIYGGIFLVVFLPIYGIILLFISVRPPETMVSPPISSWHFISGAILSLFWWGLLLFGGLLLFNNNWWLYYFSGLFFSWGIAAIGWVLIRRIKKIDKEFEPKLDLVDSEIQKEEIIQELKTAGIKYSGNIQMIINKVGYSDPMYSRKIIRQWPWRAKGRIVLTDKELIFLSMKKKNINFSIPISEIDAIQLFQARSGGLSYKNCEIVYGNPKISVIFMTFFVNLDIYNIKLQETLQKWYETWR